tara:strand:- start:8659 stop:9363 length:705 start_codon:yes stop_codon:yes gene_type:complete
MGVALAVGAVAMAGVGAYAANSAAKSQNAAAMGQYNHNTALEAWRYGEQQVQVAQKNAARNAQNRHLFEASTRNYALQQIDLAKTFEQRAKQLSKQQKAINSSVTSQLSAKMSLSSGTAQQIKKQMELQGGENWKNEFFSKINASRALKQNYENNLRQGTDLSTTTMGAFIPGLPPQMQDVGMATMMGGIKGAAQGISMVGGIYGALNAAQQYSGGMAGGGGGGGGWTPITIQQ